MAFSGRLGLALDLDAVPVAQGAEVPLLARAFAEDASRYLLEVAESDLPALAQALGAAPHAVVGRFDGSGRLSVGDASVATAHLGERWSGGLAW
jgi:hypothetical protein